MTRRFELGGRTEHPYDFLLTALMSPISSVARSPVIESMQMRKKSSSINLSPNFNRRSANVFSPTDFCFSNSWRACSRSAAYGAQAIPRSDH